MLHLVEFENDEVVSVSVISRLEEESPTKIIVRTARTLGEAVDLATAQYNSLRQRDKTLELIEYELSLYSFRNIESGYAYILLATDLKNALDVLTANNVNIDDIEVLERLGVGEVVEL
jgi:predicted S18 family serine protease